jgi:MFS superfamily sulfate permease-like transporter
MVVAWGMIERHEITLVATGARVQALAMVVTLALVVLVDLTTGIAMGCLVAALGTWIRRGPQIARKLPD